jgi:hypothetical protein
LDDDLPLVPYLITPNGLNMYDSTAIGHWINQYKCSNFIPIDPCERFICNLLDEFFDEWGLYLIHNERWTGYGNNKSCESSAGFVMSQEIGIQIASSLIASTFNVRQTKRCAYLMSISEPGRPSQNSNLLPSPPSTSDYPSFQPTRKLLHDSWHDVLTALETVFQNQKYLLGNHFTLADASCFGCFGTHILVDVGTSATIEYSYPAVYKWLLNISKGKFDSGDVIEKHPAYQTQYKSSLKSAGSPVSTKSVKFRRNDSDDLHTPWIPAISNASIKPLLAVVFRTFVPWMTSMKSAFDVLQTQEGSVYNQRAFDANKSMFTAQLQSQSVTHVVKSFQIKVWLQLLEEWKQLSSAQKKICWTIFPAQSHPFD